MYQIASRRTTDGLPSFTDRVSDAAHGLNQLVLERLIHLRAKPADVHVDEVRVVLEAHLPDFLADLAARDRFAGLASEQSEQREFLGRQIELATGPRGVAA